MIDSLSTADRRPPGAGDRRGETGAALRLERIERAYGEVRAVDGISLDVVPGEFFTLLGPSGSGKTTTLQLVAGFQTPTAGEIYLDDRRITGVPPFKRGVGVVFQSYALFPHMSVFENIAFPLRIRNVARREIAARVEEALELVKLPGYGGRRIGQLSGGQQQRVAVARAIVFKPRLLLMDEPLGALDARLRKEMQAELKRLQERLGVTVIYVTHDQEEALIMSDRIAVIRAGRVEQVAPPEQMYERPATRFVAEFIGDANVLTGRVEARAGDGVIVAVGRHTVSVPSSVASPGQTVSPGETVTLAIRPERIVIGDVDRIAKAGASAAPNALKATVVETFYTGDQTIVIVEIEDGIRLTVKEANAGPHARRAPGDRLAIGWLQEDARLLVE